MTTITEQTTITTVQETTVATVQALCDQLQALDQEVAKLLAQQARLPDLLARLAGHPILWLLIGRDGIDRAGGLGQVTGQQIIHTKSSGWWWQRRPRVAPMPELPGHCIQGPTLMDHDSITKVIARVDATALTTYEQGLALVQEVHVILAEQERLVEAQAMRTFVHQQLRWHEQQDSHIVDTVVQAYGSGGGT